MVRETGGQSGKRARQRQAKGSAPHAGRSGETAVISSSPPLKPGAGEVAIRVDHAVEGRRGRGNASRGERGNSVRRERGSREALVTTVNRCLAGAGEGTEMVSDAWGQSGNRD